MVRHVVVFRWQPDITEAQVAAVREALAALPAAIGTLRSYEFGSDLGLADGNGDFAVVATFDDVAGYEAYRDHPDHLAVIAEHIGPVLADRLAVQHEWD